MGDHRDSTAASPDPRSSRGGSRDGSTGGIGSSAGSSDATVISAGPAPPATLASSADIGRQLEGTMLGPYRLECFIGGGGMGAVFRALDTTLDRIVAVKVLAGRQADDEEMLRRFRIEAQSAARLDHENIGRVHAVGAEQGWHFIVFEYIEGRNVRDIVRDEGAFGVARTLDVAIQVADALEHASQRDVVHRDIKPSNIVITPAGRARVVDMGLARVSQVAGDGDLTASGMTLGTFDYISPEQARDPRAADVRSDLYSLGCTMFFMLAGRPPFADGTMVQKLLQHQQEPPPDIVALRPDVPASCGAIIARLMQKEPEDRYQRPADLVADLVTVAEEQGLPLAAARPGPITTVTVPPPPRSVAMLPWLVPVLALLGTVAVLWLRGATDRLRTAPADRPRPAATVDDVDRGDREGGAAGTAEGPRTIP
jgi:serine/threonine-protein kinase